MTLLIENRTQDSICSNLPTDLPIASVANTRGGWFYWLCAAHYFHLLPSQIKGTDDFCQPSDAVWQMSQHLLSPWFIGSEWPAPWGRTHQKGQALVKGSFWMPTPPTTFIPALLGLHILLLVIVWPSAVFPASLTAPLSKHGVRARSRHLPFGPLVLLHWVSLVRWGANSWRRAHDRGLSLKKINPALTCFPHKKI